MLSLRGLNVLVDRDECGPPAANFHQANLRPPDPLL